MLDMSNVEMEIQHLKAYLEKEFEIKDKDWDN